jgi:hypothetical protein
MKLKESLITLVALAAIGGASYVAYRYESQPRPNLCNVCNRGLHAGMTYRMEVHGHTEVTCCPRCGMHYAIAHAQDVKGSWATDLNSGQRIPAESASYNEGGDVEYCTQDETPVAREPHGISEREYDRCLPTLVAFKTRAEAEAYRAQHGGRVLTYQQAMASVKER